MIIWCFFLLFIFFSSCFLTYLIKKYAEKKQIIDIPNYRSSHISPTPRGGGLAFVSVCLFSLLCGKFIGIIFDKVIIFSLIVISLLGFYDDRKSLSFYFRLLVQFIVVLVVFIVLLPLPSLSLYFFSIKPGLILDLIILFYLLWLVNLYNFMDGINGIASLEAISVCLSMVFVYWLNGQIELIYSLLILAFSVLGFLLWNFPKAKIFMGDAGSNFLGLMLGIFSIQGFLFDSQLIWSWLVLLGVFIVDSSITLFRRFLNGEEFYKPHCNHAYQHAARKFASHTPVSIFVVFVNLFWLLPISILIGKHLVDGFIGLLIAYLPLILIAFYFNAGKQLNMNYDKLRGQGGFSI